MNGTPVGRALATWTGPCEEQSFSSMMLEERGISLDPYGNRRVVEEILIPGFSQARFTMRTSLDARVMAQCKPLRCVTLASAQKRRLSTPSAPSHWASVRNKAPADPGSSAELRGMTLSLDRRGPLDSGLPRTNRKKDIIPLADAAEARVWTPELDPRTALEFSPSAHFVLSELFD